MPNISSRFGTTLPDADLSFSRIGFGGDVGLGIPDKRPGHAGTDHRFVNIGAVLEAGGERPVVEIATGAVAGEISLLHHCPQECRGGLAAVPVFSGRRLTRLRHLRRVDAFEANARLADIERISVDDSALAGDDRRVVRSGSCHGSRDGGHKKQRRR